MGGEPGKDWRTALLRGPCVPHWPGPALPTPTLSAARPPSSPANPAASGDAQALQAGALQPCGPRFRVWGPGIRRGDARQVWGEGSVDSPGVMAPWSAQTLLPAEPMGAPTPGLGWALRRRPDVGPAHSQGSRSPVAPRQSCQPDFPSSLASHALSPGAQAILQLRASGCWAGREGSLDLVLPQDGGSFHSS